MVWRLSFFAARRAAPVPFAFPLAVFLVLPAFPRARDRFTGVAFFFAAAGRGTMAWREVSSGPSGRGVHCAQV